MNHNPEPTAPRVEASDATPRTDAITIPPNQSVTSDYCLLECLARRLEREVNALTTELAAAEWLLSKVNTEAWDKLKAEAAATASRLAEVERELALVLQQRDHATRCGAIADRRTLRAERLLDRAARELRDHNERQEEEGQRRSAVIDALLNDIAATPAPAPADRARVEELEKAPKQIGLEAIAARDRFFARLPESACNDLSKQAYYHGFMDARDAWGYMDAARPASGDAGKETL